MPELDDLLCNRRPLSGRIIQFGHFAELAQTVVLPLRVGQRDVARTDALVIDAARPLKEWQSGGPGSKIVAINLFDLRQPSRRRLVGVVQVVVGLLDDPAKAVVAVRIDDVVGSDGNPAGTFGLCVAVDLFHHTIQDVIFPGLDAFDGRARYPDCAIFPLSCGQECRRRIGCGRRCDCRDVLDYQSCRIRSAACQTRWSPR